MTFERPVGACIALAIAGFATFMGMPLLVGGVIEHFGFTEGQGGYLASAEYLGMFTASLLVSMTVLSFDRRRMAALGLAVAVIANLACMGLHQWPALLALRFVSGLGCGTAYAVAIAVLATLPSTVKHFSMLIFGQVLTNALVVYTFPRFIDRWGLLTIFAAYGGMQALAAFFLPWLPRRSESIAQSGPEPSDGKAAVHALVPWLCLGAVFCFYLMIGAYWAYIERIGAAVGFDDAFVGTAIALGILLSLAACNIAYFLGRRWGQSRPLLSALAVVCLAHLIGGAALGPVTFLAGLFVVNCFWNFTDIYQLGTMAHFEPSGVFASRIQGAQMLAMTISPAVAGALLDRGFGYGRLLMVLGLYVAIAFAIYAFIYVMLRSQAPHLAEARS